MKKLIFAVCIVLTVGACTNEFDDIDYIINNNSSKTVTFSFNDISESLNKDESVSFTINSGNGVFVPENISFIGHPRSVNLNSLNKGTAGIVYSFDDVTPFDLHVVNTLPIAISIKDDDFIDDNNNVTLSIEANSELTTAKIYTNNPRFEVLTSYSANIDWRFNENTVYVIIR